MKTEEQIKIRKFYKELQGWSADSVGTWIGAGFLVLFMVMAATIPLQEMLGAGDEEIGKMGWIMALLFGPLAGMLYLRPYTVITEMGYTSRARNVNISELLKYLPVDGREIRRMKIRYLLRFYGWIVPVCMGLQAATALYSYGQVTWKNILYIILIYYVWPVVTNLPMILTEQKGS